MNPEGFLSFPDTEALEDAATGAPDFMQPSRVPYAVGIEGILTDAQCDAIVNSLEHLEPYSFKACGGITRECSSDPSLDAIETIGRGLNEWFFNYDLTEGQHSWMQTYAKGNEYRRHMDGSPGQTRKLTAVALLSDPDDYEGGYLALYVRPKTFVVPRTRGTVVVFQHWVEHDVSRVSGGKRQTINMGFWGPPFR